jgi:hypothetical protein
VSKFDSRRGLGIFLFTTASRTAPGTTQPPIQWVPGALSFGVKRPRREADHSSPSSAEVKECVELYLHSQYAFMARCLVKHFITFTFPLEKLLGKINRTHLFKALHIPSPTQWAPGVLSPGVICQIVKPTTDHLYLMPRLRMHGAIPPRYEMILRHRDKFTFSNVSFGTNLVLYNLSLMLPSLNLVTFRPKIPLFQNANLQAKNMIVPVLCTGQLKIFQIVWIILKVNHFLRSRTQTFNKR